MTNLFTLVVGISITNFNDLYSKVGNVLANTTVFGHIKGIGGRAPKIDAQGRLLLTLIWMRHYTTESLLEWIFEIPAKQVHTYIRSSVGVLFTSLRNTLHFPSYSNRMRQSIPWRGRYIVIVIDGTEQHILKPHLSMFERLVYSGKKRKHTLTKLLMVSPSGIIYYLSPSYPGSCTDQVLLAMQENAVYDWITWGECILGDAGFKNLAKLSKTKCQYVLPYDEHTKPAWTVEDEKFMSELKSIRTIVENVISHIKKWRICKDRFRSRCSNFQQFLDFHHEIWVVVAALVNLYEHNLKYEQVE